MPQLLSYYYYVSATLSRSIDADTIDSIDADTDDEDDNNKQDGICPAAKKTRRVHERRAMNESASICTLVEYGRAPYDEW